MDIICWNHWMISPLGLIPLTLMLASDCPEIDTRWPYEYGILNFVRRWSLSHTRSWSKYNAHRKSQDDTQMTHLGNTKMWICFPIVHPQAILKYIGNIKYILSSQGICSKECSCVMCFVHRSHNVHTHSFANILIRSQKFKSNILYPWAILKVSGPQCQWLAGCCDLEIGHLLKCLAWWLPGG